MSMNPGAIVLPAASMTRAAGASIRRPIRAIVSPRTAMSPRYQGLPVPSTIRPFLMIRSYAGGWAPGAAAANARRTTETRDHMPRTITRIVAADTSSLEGLRSVEWPPRIEHGGTNRLQRGKHSDPAWPMSRWYDGGEPDE